MLDAADGCASVEKGEYCGTVTVPAKVVHGDKDYPSGLRKLGAILADGADLGCGCVCNPGTVVGKNTSVYPLTALRGMYPAECIVKSADCVVKRK